MSVLGKLLLIVAASAMVGSCGSDGSGGGSDGSTNSTTTTEPGADLESTSWLLTGWTDGTEMVESAASASLKFGADGQLSGSTGCNRFSGSWSVDDSSLTISLGPMTLAGCVDPIAADQEQAVVSAMAETTAYEGGIDSLALLDGDGNSLLDYMAVSDDLSASAWQATGINNGNGGVETNASTALASIEFEDTGMASGSGGCNGFTASWSVTGQSISISELSITEKSCGAELDTLEQQYEAALGAATRYSVEGSTLELRDDSGALQVSFKLAT